MLKLAMAKKDHNAQTPQTMTRRRFVQGLAATGSGLATIGASGACSDSGTTPPGPVDAGGAPSDGLVPKVDGGGQQTATVHMVTGGDCFTGIAKLWEMLGGVEAHIDPSDTVIIKANGQWPYQGYTHTGCIKAVIDGILAMEGFTGEIFICDNVQEYGYDGDFGFDAGETRRTHNWPDHNWNSLAAEYQSQGKKVATKRWKNGGNAITGPSGGEGWVRDFFTFNGLKTFLSYPIFESPLTAGRMIDPKGGVWQDGAYTGEKVKSIFMPTLNNHGYGSSDYAGATSAIKSFYGATEITGGADGRFEGAANIHGSSFSRDRADYGGELVARYIQNFYAPALYITAAIWSGWHSRTGEAKETKTVLAGTDPASLDYIACKEVLWPAHKAFDFLNPDNENNTRKQIQGCVKGGVGISDPERITVVRATI